MNKHYDSEGRILRHRKPRGCEMRHAAGPTVFWNEFLQKRDQRVCGQEGRLFQAGLGSPGARRTGCVLRSHCSAQRVLCSEPDAPLATWDSHCRMVLSRCGNEKFLVTGLWWECKVTRRWPFHTSFL